MLLKIVYLLTCRVLGVAALALRHLASLSANSTCARPCASSPARSQAWTLHKPPGSSPSISLHVDTVSLTRLYILVFIEHGTRRMPVGGVTAHPTGDWTMQQARNLALELGERFTGFRFLIRDRGSNFTTSFDAVFQATGATIVRTAVRAPRMNAICERLISTLHREVLDRTLVLNQAHLRAVLAEYQEHYNTARPHQGIGQRVPDPDPAPCVPAADPGSWQIRRKPVLSGLINEYERAA